MEAYNFIFAEMPLVQLHHWFCNMGRGTILHENDSIQTSTPLGCWNDLVLQKILIAFASDGTGNEIRKDPSLRETMAL